MSARPTSGSEAQGDASPRFLLRSTVFLGAAAVVPALAAAFTDLEPQRAADLHRLLRTSTVLLAAAVFASSLVRPPASDAEGRPWVLVGVLLVGIAAAADPAILGALLPGGGWRDPLLKALSQAATVLALGAFGAGLADRNAQVRGARSWTSVGAMVALAIVVLTALFRAAPDLADAVTVAADDGRAGAGASAADVAVAVLWLAVAVAYVVGGQLRLLSVWRGLLLSALAASQVAQGFADGGLDDPLSVSASAVQAAGMLVALMGCWQQGSRTPAERTTGRVEAEIVAETIALRERLRQAERRRERHDVANVMTTVEGAAFVLERDFDRLSADDRTLMRGILQAGTARLRALLDDDGAAGPLSLAEAVAGLIKERGSTTEVHVDVAADLVAAGPESEAVEAVRQLLTHACVRAPGEPVTVRSERDGNRVVLRVEDRGPSVTGKTRRPIGATDSGQADSDSHPIGLIAAARLLRSRGGELWVEPRPGGGASFGLSLPAATADDGDQQGT